MSPVPCPWPDAATVRETRDATIALSHRIHADPELGFAEHRALAAVRETIEPVGASLVTGLAGLDTALSATTGTPGPTVAILAEFDALPEIGHGCGHNVICAAGVGAFLLAARALALPGAPAGRVVLVTTPAEETGTGKELLARAGVFDDVDAAMMVHPYGGPSALRGTFAGLREVRMTFHGRAAHAAAAPAEARNALDAVVGAYQSIAALRQHLPSGDVLHGVITDGGASPNVIPDRAACHYYLRSGSMERLVALSERVGDIARGAALATGTSVELAWDDLPPCLPVHTNDALADRFAERWRELGHDIAEATDPPLVGSTDMGNVSYRVPAIHPVISLGDPGSPLHSARFAALAGTDRSGATAADAAVALARTALDLLADPRLLATVAREFERTVGQDADRALDALGG